MAGHRFSSALATVAAAVLAGGCSPTEGEQAASTQSALHTPVDTTTLTFHVTGVRAPASSILNSASAVFVTMRTSWDDNQAIGSQRLFQCGTALGSTFGNGIPCNQGGDAKFHAYPAYANANLTGVSTLPDVYIRNESAAVGQQTASVDVTFGLTPTGSSPGTLTVFTSSSASFQLDVDLATGAVEPSFGQPAGAVCGFRRADGTTTGSCARTCPATGAGSGPECRQNCVFLSSGGASPWEICYEVDITPPDTVTTYTLPYFVQTILYEAPGDRSEIEFGTSNTMGTSTEWSTTLNLGLSVEVGGEVEIEGVDFGGSSTATFATSTISGGATSHEKTTGWSFTAKDPDDERHDVPNPDHDLYFLILGAEVRRIQPGDPTLPPNYTVNLSKGRHVPLTVLQLKDLLQTDPQLRLARILPTYHALVSSSITPADAQKILALNPRVSGQDIRLLPDRFQRATTPVLPLLGTQRGIGQTGTIVFKQITVEGSETSQGQGSSETFANEVKLGPFTFGESLEVEYQNVTKVSTSAELTASIGLKSSQECVAADVEVFLDRAFGSFVTIPNFFDACAIDPMRTMSFEATSAWQVQNGTSTLSTDSVSGVRSLAVTANGWTSLVSGPLSSALLRGAARSADLSQVSYALRIPASQPNPSWVGASQMYITSPSANVYNAYMGQVELTPLPRGGFVRLGFSIPPAALHVLTEDHPDVSFTIILNVNPGAPAWLVDDLAIGAVDPGGTGGSGGTGGTSGGALVGTLALSSNWDGGFCQVLSLTNNGPTRVSSWSAVVNLGGAVVSQLWNGACSGGGCLGRTGTITVSSVAGWQGIEPGTTYNQTGWCTSPDNGVNGGSLVTVTGN